MSPAHQTLEVFLRAGGGHSFGGGGGGYSGGGGGGGYSLGGGGSSGLFLGALFGGPGFVVLMLLFYAVSYAMRSRAGPPPMRTSYAPPPMTAPTAGDPRGGIAAIRAHDPAFDLNNFLARVQRSFFLIQQAWMECKPEISRRVMADTLWEQHRMQIAGYVQRHAQNRMDELAVGNEIPVGATSDGTFDTITVRITAACSDYDVDVTTGKIIRGNRAVRTWAEDWQFQRSSKATTRPDGGVMNDKCPNCGAPLDVDLAGVCSYCHSQIMGGEYDWVLDRISQV